MGKNHAPPYANLVIAYLILEKLYPRIEKDFSIEVVIHIQESLKLFLDDGFMLLDQNIIRSEILLQYLNEMDPCIKFTMEQSEKEIPFLDVLIKVDHNNQISTDIYRKDTDTGNYFRFDSCAPKHIPRNLPYNLTKRISTIVSDPQIRDLRLEELKYRLLAKKYPIHLIEDSIKKAKSYNRDELLTLKPKQQPKQAVTLVVDFNPNVRNDPAITIKNACKNLMLTEKAMNGKKDAPQIIVARRQPPSLARTLSLSVNRDHNLPENYNEISYKKCRNSLCVFCTIAIKENTYTTKNGTILKRNQSMSCKSMDLIYLLVCKNCKEEYCGETGAQINDRANLHRSQAKNEQYRNLNVSKHIHQCAEGQFLIFPFHKCFNQCHYYREAMELHYRELIKPKLH